MKHLIMYEGFLNESEFTPRDEMIEKLRKRFPNIWFKKAEEFGKNQSPNGIWTGSEGNTFVDKNKKITAFNPVDSYFYNSNAKKSYVDEVHVTLDKFLKDNGYYAEFYDAATIFLYPIHNTK